jgi:hypothetical protein
MVAIVARTTTKTSRRNLTGGELLDVAEDLAGLDVSGPMTDMHCTVSPYNARQLLARGFGVLLLPAGQHMFTNVSLWGNVQS